jgi:hypothetical protein
MTSDQTLDSVQKVSDVVDALTSGRLNVPEEHRAWADRLLSLPRGTTGLLDISTLSQEDVVRAKATAVFLRGIAQEKRETDSIASLNMHDAQCELFRLFEKLFIGLTGVASGVVETEADIQRLMLNRVRTRQESMAREVNATAEELENFYEQNAGPMFRAAKQLGGVKVVLGGQRAFGSSALEATRVAGLYCDTQLIPDPVYPFFSANLHLNAMHLQLALVLFHILPLRPLVEARLSEPPILVFPSFEQGLERNDAVTQAGIASLTVKVVGPSCNASIQSIGELTDFARSHEEEFLEAVMRNRLFVPPGVDPQTILTPQEAASSYISSQRGIRSDKALKIMEKAPLGALLLNGILERLSPQYHLLENAEELTAQPLLSQQAHWHYFERCASAEARSLVNANVISRDSFDVLRAIQDDSLKWLANIPVEGLTDLRRNREHTELREQLKKFTAQLAAAGATDLQSVTREVRHGLEAMVSMQQKAIEDIERRYSPSKWKAAAGAAMGVATAAGMSFLPALAAVAGVTAPMVTAVGSVSIGAVAYAKELVGEAVEKRQAQRSLLGMLAIAHKRSQPL